MGVSSALLNRNEKAAEIAMNPDRVMFIER
jgi:hypothetical protein